MEDVRKDVGYRVSALFALARIFLQLFSSYGHKLGSGDECYSPITFRSCCIFFRAMINALETIRIAIAFLRN